ncbi:unnamed protein product [Cyclocybe aegerita]|uniref:DUF6535 domain-containing protein n=1 Tax=Cyclocybe aegerita TaxID=1973307 RepID=A0A8S0WAH1_CYCAE|nr:unnamed protein product [Cyclocybe aegerita]
MTVEVIGDVQHKVSGLTAHTSIILRRNPEIRTVIFPPPSPSTSHKSSSSITSCRKPQSFVSALQKSMDSGYEASNDVTKAPSIMVQDAHSRGQARPSFTCGTPLFSSPKKEEGVNYWERVLAPVWKKDKAQCDAWKDEVQNLLIFAGLFSAVVTAFIVESHKNLQQDPNETVVALLARIVTQLERQSNGSSPVPTSDPDPTSIPFTPSPSSVRVNAFWFLSLVLSLTTVLIGIISLQWIREHQSYPEHFSPEQIFTVLHLRTRMLREWRVSAFFKALPILLELALMLFFIGLADFLGALKILEVIIPVSLILTLTLAFLILTTALPTFHVLALSFKKARPGNSPPVPCPYKSPQAQIFHSSFTLLFSAVPSLTNWIKFHGSQMRSRSFFDNFMDPGALNWTALDLRWMLLRRYNFSSFFGGPYELTPYRYDWDLEDRWRRGAIYDRIDALDQLARRYHSSLDIKEAGYHCFVDSITDLPNTSIRKDISAMHRAELLSSLAKFLQHTRSRPPELVDISSDLAFTHDVAILEFIGVDRSFQTLRLELEIRVREFFAANLAGKLLPTNIDDSWKHHRAMTNTAQQATSDLEDSYVDHVFENLAQSGKMSWTIHFLFSAAGFPHILRRYVNGRPLKHSALLKAIAVLQTTIDNYVTSVQSGSKREAEDLHADDKRAAQSFLLGTCLISLYAETNFRDMPQPLLDLALALRPIHDLFFHIDSPHPYKRIHGVLQTVLGSPRLELVYREVWHVSKCLNKLLSDPGGLSDTSPEDCEGEQLPVQPLPFSIPPDERKENMNTFEAENGHTGSMPSIIDTGLSGTSPPSALPHISGGDKKKGIEVGVHDSARNRQDSFRLTVGRIFDSGNSTKGTNHGEGYDMV